MDLLRGWCIEIQRILNVSNTEDDYERSGVRTVHRCACAWDHDVPPSNKPQPWQATVLVDTLMECWRLFKRAQGLIYRAELYCFEEEVTACHALSLRTCIRTGCERWPPAIAATRTRRPSVLGGKTATVSPSVLRALHIAVIHWRFLQSYPVLDTLEAIVSGEDLR